MDNSGPTELEASDTLQKENEILQQRLKALRDECERLANRLLEAERVDAEHDEQVTQLTARAEAAAERVTVLENDLADHHKTLAYVLLTAGRKLRDRMQASGN